MNILFKCENPVKVKLYNGQVSLGAFLLSSSSFIAEAMVSQGLLDWVLIDMEASDASKQDLVHILQALNAYEVTPIVRISDQNKHMIESSLDFGALGIMIPKVDNSILAEDFTNACYYPPKGKRGINCIRASAYYHQPNNYFSKANNAILSIVQIESKESISQLDSIAKNENIDVLFIGLGDLAASYGQIGSVSGELIDNARKQVVDVCEKFGKIPGIFAHSIDVARQYKKEGFLFIAIGNDIKFLNHGLFSYTSKFNK